MIPTPSSLFREVFALVRMSFQKNYEHWTVIFSKFVNTCVFNETSRTAMDWAGLSVYHTWWCTSYYVQRNTERVQQSVARWVLQRSVRRYHGVLFLRLFSAAWSSACSAKMKKAKFFPSIRNNRCITLHKCFSSGVLLLFILKTFRTIQWEQTGKAESLIFSDILLFLVNNVSLSLVAQSIPYRRICPTFKKQMHTAQLPRSTKRSNFPEHAC